MPWYRSHKCDQSVEKYPFNLLDQYLLSKKPYALGMSTTKMLMHWWTQSWWYSWMITSRSSPMVGTHVRSSCIICTNVLLHFELIYLAMESGMTLVDAPKSTKYLWTLQLKISNESKNGGKTKFDSSILSVLRTIVIEPGDVLAPLLVEVLLSADVFPSVRRIISR